MPRHASTTYVLVVTTHSTCWLLLTDRRSDLALFIHSFIHSGFFLGRITYPPLLPFHLHTHTYPLNCLLHFVPSLEQLDSAYNRSFFSYHITSQSWVLCNNTLIYTILGNSTHGRISTAFTHSSIFSFTLDDSFLCIYWCCRDVLMRLKSNGTIGCPKALFTYLYIWIVMKYTWHLRLVCSGLGSLTQNSIGWKPGPKSDQIYIK